VVATVYPASRDKDGNHMTGEEQVLQSVNFEVIKSENKKSNFSCTS
jgi:hypothetical protein